MNKISLFSIGTIFFFACNDDNSQMASRTSKGSVYPKIIDSLHLQTVFDDTKWHLYSLNCDDTPKNKSGNFLVHPAVPYASMDLKFDSVNYKTDTVKLYFTYYWKEGPVSCLKYHDLQNPPVMGMGHIKNVDTIVWYLTNCVDAIGSFRYSVPKAFLDTTTDRYYKPLQPDVIKFLKSNGKVLDPWFYDQAVKRGYLN